MDIDLSGVVEDFSLPYTVTRTALATYDANGDVVAGSTSTFSIQACVQPVSGRDLFRMPEGLRTQELLAVFTATELRTKSSANEPDTISITGVTYQVQQVDRWAELGVYWRVVVAKVGTA